MKKFNIRPLINRLLKPCYFLKNLIVYDFKKLIKNFGDHDGELSTCALAFYALISFIPASLVIISILSFFYKSESMANFYLNQIKSQLPSINVDDLMKIIDRIVYKKRYIAFIWVPFLFWWGSLIFDIIERILDKAFLIRESRKYWIAKIRHILIILGIGFIILAFIIVSNIFAFLQNSYIAEIIKNIIPNPDIVNFIITFLSDIPFFLKSLSSIITNTILFFIIYRFVPAKKIDNKSILKGSIFASSIYILVKYIFSYYIIEINDYTSIFGSLSSIVILMIWIWFTCFIFVMGAEMAWIFFEKNKKTSAEIVNL